MSTLLDCIERIPSRFRYMMEHEAERMKELHAYIQNKDIHKVIFVGCGSSYNAALMAQPFYENLDIETEFYFANVFLNYHKSLHRDALYVLISQGGSTKVVYDVALRLKASGCNCCCISEDTKSLIARSVDVALDMGCQHEEFMYRTLGFSTAVMTCIQMALCIGEHHHTLTNKDEIMEDMTTLIKNLPNIEETALTWYKQHRFALMQKQHMIFSGAGELWPVAIESDIKVMEMVPILTRCFELEELIHGPQNAFDASTAYFIFVKAKEEETKAAKIASFLKEQIGFCCVIGPYDGDHRDMKLPIATQYFNALEYITVMQVIAYQLAIDHGRDLAFPVHASMKRYIVKTV